MRIGNINGVGYNHSLIQTTKQQSSAAKEKLVNSTYNNSNDDVQDNYKSSMAEFKERLEASKNNSKAYEDMAKLLEIARRISSGDKVPYKDEKKLLEFSPELYQAAKVAAILHANKKPKEHKSMFEDEEENKTYNGLQPLKVAVSEGFDKVIGDEVVADE